MHEPDFTAIESALLAHGIAARRARRMADELEDHYEDLLRDGEEDAAGRLGSIDTILASARSYPELRSWAFRHPRIAVLLYPLACCAVLPAVPIRAGVSHAAALGRWAVSALFSGVVTASIFLTLTAAIAFG